MDTLSTGVWLLVWASLLFAIGAGLFGCGGYAVGPTSVSVAKNGDAWPDLPEALGAMQMFTYGRVGGARHREIWDAHVVLFPAWSKIGRPGQACLLYPEIDEIHARVVRELEPATRDGCLPHEFAHRWRGAEGGNPRAHDERFWELDGLLRAAASETWYVRRTADVVP